MRQIREFQSNFENISCECHRIVTRLSYDSCETFVRVSHDVPTNVALFSFVRQSQDIRESVAQHSYEFAFNISVPQLPIYMYDELPIKYEVVQTTICIP